MNSLTKLYIACPACEGRGWFETTEPEHDCGGDEGTCHKVCPIGIPRQVECEVCLEGKSSVERLSNIGYSNFDIVRIIKES